MESLDVFPGCIGCPARGRKAGKEVPVTLVLAYQTLDVALHLGLDKPAPLYLISKRFEPGILLFDDCILL